MRISTRGRYALAAMTLLASQQEQASISIRDIAKATGISEKYLEQLFIQLKKSGLIGSIQGAGGGYRLARDASTICAGDVLRSVESSFSLMPCLADDACGRAGACVTRGVWEGLQGCINTVVDGITLDALAEELAGMPQSRTAPEYYI